MANDVTISEVFLDGVKLQSVKLESVWESVIPVPLGIVLTSDDYNVLTSDGFYVIPSN